MALENVRTNAETLVCGPNFKPTPGGDAYEYIGSMTQVELLREALDQYHSLFYRLKKEKQK